MKKTKKVRKIKPFTIVMIVIDILVGVCFFLFYGPITSFKNMIISTSMITKTHQWIAYTFYSEEDVAKIVASNSYVVPQDNVDLDAITIDTSEKDSYGNQYDEAVLKRNEGNDNYKIFDVKVGKYDAHMVEIYDPSKVNLITSPAFNTGRGQETIINMCKRNGGTVCINAGGFQDLTGYGSDIPIGYVIKEGEIIWSDNSNKSNIIGMTYDNKLLLINATGDKAIAQGMRDGIEFGPFLIVNGNKITSNSAAGGYDRAARVAIGQRKDGVILFLVTEGVHTKGPTLTEMADTLELYGAYNAANLDGGTSAQLVENGKLINTPKNVYGKVISSGRRVVSGWALILE